MEVEAVVEAGDERKEEEKSLENEVVIETDEVIVNRERESKTKAGEESKFVEGIVEDVRESAESGSEGEEDGENAKKEDSEGTKMVSEEKTEVLGSGDQEEKEKKNVEDQMDQEEEVDQEIEEEEWDIVVLDDEDDTEVIDENKPEEGNDGRTTRRRTRFARRLAEILTTGQDKQVESDPAEVEEEEEEDELLLKRRLRSTRASSPVDRLFQLQRRFTPVLFSPRTLHQYLRRRQPPKS